MLKIKQVVETEVELPAPDIMTLVWRNPKFDIESLLSKQYVKVKGQSYRVEGYSVYSQDTTPFRLVGYTDTYLSVDLEKVNVAVKEKK